MGWRLVFSIPSIPADELERIQHTQSLFRSYRHWVRLRSNTHLTPNIRRWKIKWLKRKNAHKAIWSTFWVAENRSSSTPHRTSLCLNCSLDDTRKMVVRPAITRTENLQLSDYVCNCVYDYENWRSINRAYTTHNNNNNFESVAWGR